MKLRDNLKAKATVRETARRFGVSPKECKAEIQKVIDAAWTEAWLPGNISAQVTWQQLFPGGKKPSVEEFIMILGKQTA